MDKKKTKEVGERIRQIRKQLGYSMEEFAKRIDEKAKSGTVSNWETGKNLPNNKRLRRIAELGETSTLFLLMGNNAFLFGKVKNHLEFGRLLEDARKAKNLSLHDVSSMSGLTLKEIETAEKPNNEGFPSRELIEKISPILDLDLHMLLKKSGYDNAADEQSYYDLIEELKEIGVDTNSIESLNTAKHNFSEYKNKTPGNFTTERPLQYPLDLRELLDDEPAMIINKEKIKFQLLYADEELSEEDKKFLIQVMDRTLNPDKRGE